MAGQDGPQATTARPSMLPIACRLGQRRDGCLDTEMALLQVALGHQSGYRTMLGPMGVPATITSL